MNQVMRAEQFAEWLTTALRREDQSYEKLAERAGVSKATIANLAAARRTPDRPKPTLPSADMVRALARGLATDGLGGVSAEKESEYYYTGLVALGSLPNDDDAALAEARRLMAEARAEGLPSVLKLRPGMSWTWADTEAVKTMLNACRRIQERGLPEPPAEAHRHEATQ